MKTKLNLRNSRRKVQRRNLDDRLTIYIEGEAKEYYEADDVKRENINDRVHCFLYFVFQKENNEHGFNKYMTRYNYLKE